MGLVLHILQALSPTAVCYHKNFLYLCFPETVFEMVGSFWPV